MKSCFLVSSGSAGSSPTASGGRSRGRRLDQTASESAAARKSGETAVARQESRGPVRTSVADRRSSGRRSISQRAGAVAVDSIDSPATSSDVSRLLDSNATGERAMWGSTQGSVSQTLTADDSGRLCPISRPDIFESEGKIRSSCGDDMWGPRDPRVFTIGSPERTRTHVR